MKNIHNIEIPISRIFEQLAYYIAQSNCHCIKSEQEKFLILASAIPTLFLGSRILPVGLLCKKFNSIYLPECWITELETNQYWPAWYDYKTKELVK